MDCDGIETGQSQTVVFLEMEQPCGHLTSQCSSISSQSLIQTFQFGSRRGSKNYIGTSISLRSQN